MWAVEARIRMGFLDLTHNNLQEKAVGVKCVTHCILQDTNLLVQERHDKIHARETIQESIKTSVIQNTS